MKLLLTSGGLTNQKIKHHFLKLVDKPIPKIKVIFIPTASSRTTEELEYVKQSKRELLDLGINPKNIITLHLDKPVSYLTIKDGDVMYVCGGNTFYLLDRIRKTSFDKTIKKFINDGKLYLGVSAGSIIVGPDISIALPYDENDVKMIDFSGLKIIDRIIHAHYLQAEREFVTTFQKKIKFPVIPLTDQQALIVIDEQEEII